MNVLRHFSRHNNNNGNPRAQNPPQADDMDDMPPLEPISVQTPSRTRNGGAAMADAQIPPAVNPIGDNQEDVDMPPALDPAYASFEQPTRQRDNDSMPDLQSVSDSSDESNGSVDEVEMMPDLQPVEDDNDSSWTSDDDDGDDDLPPLEPIAGNRRARVEDDEDDDRDRRHPSQRTRNARAQSGPNQQQAPPFFAGINPPRGVAPPGMVDLFQTFMGGAGSPAGTPQGVNTNAGANRTNQNTDAGHQHHHGPVPGMPPIHFTVDVGDGVPRRWGGPDGAFEPPPGLAEVLFPDMTAEERTDPLAQFQALIERLGGAMGQAFGFPFEEEKEDPERAKKLVAGLEEVPVGLVRRMEKVGGAPGGHVDDSTGEVEVPGCAICWDTLLDAEGEGFKSKESETVEAHSEEVPAEPVPFADNIPNDVAMMEQPSTQSQDTLDSSSDPPIPVITSDPSTPVDDPAPTVPATPAETPVDEDPHKIVSLPCAHVFHTSCLIPWFSRPRQTTCPTCRFNIDPENLTYVPRPRRQQPHPAFTAAPAPGAPAPAPAANAPPVGGDAPADGGPAADADALPSAGAPPNAGTPPNAPPNTTPGNPQGGARGIPAGFAMFGNPGNVPFQFIPVPVGQGQQDIAAIFDGMFRPQQGAGQPGTPQGAPPGAPPDAPQGTPTQGPPPPQQPPPFFMAEGAPPPMFNPNPGQGGRFDHNDPNGMFTVDFTLFTNSPFEGNGVRRQTHVFANQIFGGEGPGDAPGGGAPQHPPPPVPGGIPQFAQGPRPTRPPPRPSREKKQWTPPPAPGPTLRNRVEEREREVGLRCCDTSCGVGPSDEDPFPDVYDTSMKQLSIRPLPNSLAMNTSVCSHTFHPACLVSAERVAGWGGEDKKEDQVEVSCPNCRAVGCVSREEWEEGVCGLA
jgi:hypothetical protein